MAFFSRYNLLLNAGTDEAPMGYLRLEVEKPDAFAIVATAAQLAILSTSSLAHPMSSFFGL